MLTSSVGGTKKLIKGQQASIIGTGSSNPSTGYSWNVSLDESGKCGPKGSVTMHQHFESPPTRIEDGGPVLGAGGVEHFSFTATDSAIKGAKCHVGFVYAQSWAKPSGW